MSAVSLSSRDRARTQARALLGRAGARIAALDDRPQAHRVLVRALPQALSHRFDSSRADGLETVMELRLRDPSGGAPARFTIRIADGACRVTPGAAPDPSAGAELGGDDIIRLVTGAAGWPQLLATKRLSMFGDPFLALRFPLLFRLPARAADGA